MRNSAVLALAIVALLIAIAYRGASWLSSEATDAQPVASSPEKKDEPPTGWEADARRFDAEKGPAAAILTAADKVEPFRVQPVFTAKPASLEAYPIVSRAPVLGPDFAARLASVLLEPESYIRPGQDTKLCLFQPRVAFRVWRGADFVDVLVCFDCTQLMVVEQDPAVPERLLGSKTARFRVGGDFDPVFGDLEKLTREAFHGDPALEEILNPDGTP